MRTSKLSTPVKLLGAYSGEKMLILKLLSMFGNDPDKDWEAWGRENPYYGVYRHPKFLGVHLDSDARQDFFKSGEDHVERVYRVIETKVRSGFTPTNALDYGCGVGRLALALARRCPAVTGVDVSTSMLTEARRNFASFNVGNARFLHVDEMAELRPKSFDFIHSFIVFQHIPSRRGEAILRRLTTLLTDKGVGALQFTFSDSRLGWWAGIHRIVSTLRERVSVVNGACNVIRGRPFKRPIMQMNQYSLNRLFQILLETGCHNVYVDFSDHGGFLGATLYFEKNT